MLQTGVVPPLQVVEQPQPYGEQGVRFSLDEVARRAARGGLDARVRGWAIEQLERARRELGIRCDNDRERATVLLGAVQKKLWVPDPVGAEWMAGAHLLACDVSTPDSICMHGSDCDDLTILLGACLLGVGIYVAVVGHAYNGSQSIGHVLLAAWVDGQWEYADPSTDLALGKCVKFSRERLISVPNVKVICDANVCLRERTDYHPEQNDFVAKGVFVGVDGPPVSAPKFSWNAYPSALGAPTTEQQAAAAAEAELKKSGPSNKEKAQAAAGAAAGIAATAACAELGVAAVACGAVASAVTGYIVGAISDLFGSAGPATPASVGQFKAGVSFLTQLQNKTLTPLTGKTYASSDMAARMRAMGAQEPVTVWAQAVNGPVIQKIEAQIMAEAAVLKAEKEAQARAGKQPLNMKPKSSSSSIVPVLAIAGAAGGLYWWLR